VAFMIKLGRNQNFITYQNYNLSLAMNYTVTLPTAK